MTTGTWEYRSELEDTSRPKQVTKLAKALEDGWEPFAVTDDRRDQFGIQNSRTVHLRRFVPAAVRVEPTASVQPSGQQVARPVTQAQKRRPR